MANKLKSHTHIRLQRMVSEIFKEISIKNSYNTDTIRLQFDAKRISISQPIYNSHIS